MKRLTSELAAFKHTIKELTDNKERVQREGRDALAAKQLELDCAHRQLLDTQTALAAERAAAERQQDQTRAALHAAQAEARAFATRVAELHGALEAAEKLAQQWRADEGAARLRHDSLQQQQVTDTDAHVRALQQLTTHIDVLKRQYFFATALSLKLGLFYQGKHANETLQDMYEALQQPAVAVPFSEWPTWIAQRLAAIATSQVTTTQRAAPASAAPPAKRRKVPK